MCGVSPSVSWGPSRPGTIRCRWPPGRSFRRSPRATPSCSSPPRSPRSPRCSSPRPPPGRASPTVSSTSSPGPGERPGSGWAAIPAWARSPLPGRTPWGNGGARAVGKRVAEIATATVKRLHLELGGKAPFVVFDDADLEAAVNGAVAGALINTGQDCTAATRAYVQRPLYDAFVEKTAALMETVRLGDPFAAGTDLGPLISHVQRDRVAGFVDRARAYARVVTGGEVPEGELAKGAYYRPTLVADAAQDSEIVQSEIFGPVLVVLPFDTDDEGLRLANDTPYGLAASAWSRDVYRANRATREIRAGCVWINDHIPIISEMPHGGFCQSGFGKDLSAYSFEEYTQVKHVMFDNTAVARKDWHRTIFGDRT